MSVIISVSFANGDSGFQSIGNAQFRQTGTRNLTLRYTEITVRILSGGLPYAPPADLEVYDDVLRTAIESMSLCT